MKKLTELLARGLLACTLVILFLAVTPFAYAEYEIDTSSEENFSINVPTDGTLAQLKEDLVMSWEKPAVIEPDQLLSYIYKWSDNGTELSDDDFNINKKDGEIDKAVTTYQEAANFFADDDSNYIRYLHIKTLFYDSSEGVAAYSSDVVIGGTTGGINIDNVAPTGTVRITDSEGIDITSTYSASLNLRLSASLAPVKMYLSETDTRGGSADYASEVVYVLIDTNTGEKTIYAWFEDGVGNISTAPATDSVTLLAPVSISPYELIDDDALDLATVSEQVFAVDGNDDSYTWTIIEETADTEGDDVADFSGGVNTGNSVTITLLNPGTFKLEAVPSGVGDTLTSGTINVIKSTIQRQFTLVYNVDNTSVNAISFPVAVHGLNTISDLYALIPDCDGIQWWDAATQQYKPYSQWVPETNLSLSVGGVYFVSISQSPAQPFTFEGTEEDVQFTIIHNDDNTSVNSISVPYDVTLANVSELYASIPGCDGIQWWDAATQQYKPYSQWVPETNIAIEKGDPFFVSVTATTLWP